MKGCCRSVILNWEAGRSLLETAVDPRESRFGLAQAGLDAVNIGWKSV
jgi:hypothetical protein